MARRTFAQPLMKGIAATFTLLVGLVCSAIVCTPAMAASIQNPVVFTLGDSLETSSVYTQSFGAFFGTDYSATFTDLSSWGEVEGTGTAEDPYVINFSSGLLSMFNSMNFNVTPMRGDSAKGAIQGVAVTIRSVDNVDRYLVVDGLTLNCAPGKPPTGIDNASYRFLEATKGVHVTFGSSFNIDTDSTTDARAKAGAIQVDEGAEVVLGEPGSEKGPAITGWIKNAGSLVVNAGTCTNGENASPAIVNAGGTIAVNGGSISGDETAMYLQGPAAAASLMSLSEDSPEPATNIVTIAGGEVKGPIGILNAGATLVVSGEGEVETNATSEGVVEVQGVGSSSASYSPAAIVNVGSSSTNTQLTGGKVSGNENAPAILNGGAPSGTEASGETQLAIEGDVQVEGDVKNQGSGKATMSGGSVSGTFENEGSAQAAISDGTLRDFVNQSTGTTSITGSANLTGTLTTAKNATTTVGSAEETQGPTIANVVNNGTTSLLSGTVTGTLTNGGEENDDATLTLGSESAETGPSVKSLKNAAKATLQSGSVTELTNSKTAEVKGGSVEKLENQSEGQTTMTGGTVDSLENSGKAELSGGSVESLSTEGSGETTIPESGSPTITQSSGNELKGDGATSVTNSMLTVTITYSGEEGSETLQLASPATISAPSGKTIAKVTITKVGDSIKGSATLTLPASGISVENNSDSGGAVAIKSPYNGSERTYSLAAGASYTTPTYVRPAPPAPVNPPTPDEPDTPDTPDEPTPQEPAVIPVYRLYNPQSQAHLLTADAHEVSVLTQNRGWTLEKVAGNAEGIAFYQYGKPSADSSIPCVPVYRLYNARTGEHLYTTFGSEVSALTAPGKGWSLDESVFYAPAKSVTPVYRLYEPNASSALASHLWTADANEFVTLTQLAGNMRWQAEGVDGVAWFAVAGPSGPAT